MAEGYNPYRKLTNSSEVKNLVSEIAPNQEKSFFSNRLAKLSMFGRNYEEAAIKNAKGIQANEDLAVVVDSSGYNYSLFSRKAYALMQERTSIASLNAQYATKLPILKEYATKGEISALIAKLANEIIVYKNDKKFCELQDLPKSYSATIIKKAKEIFENIYFFSGFSDGTLGWDVCRDWLVEGYICREIIYDKKGKNIIGFQKLDPASVTPVIDPQTGLKLWVQHAYDERNRRVLLDAEIVYISYSGASNYMETSYVEPLIKPYNELKTIERARLLFNLINATMHKEFVIPVNGLSPAQAEMEINNLISSYKDKIQFDDSTGEIFIDGSKDLPYSKEYWLPTNGESTPSMTIVEPAGHDLNENTQLIWFGNNFKKASKFPLTRLDGTIGGGNIYSSGADVSHDDYNFTKYVQRLRVLYKDILLKPVILQLLIEFPELDDNNKLYNDLNIIFYGNSEVEQARTLANLQAKSTIAADLTNNLKKLGEDGVTEVPVLHYKFIMKHIMEFTEDQMLENDKYWKEDKAGSAAGSSGGGGSTSEQPTSEQPTGTETSTETPTETPNVGTETPETPSGGTEAPQTETPSGGTETETTSET